MKRITFFKQARASGVALWGIRTDGTTIWQHIDSDRDLESVLLWYVNVEFLTESWKGNAQKARGLFLDHVEPIRAALTEVIEALRQEPYALVWPITSKETEIANGMKLLARFSAIQRLQPRDVLPPVTDLERNWEQHIAARTREEKPPCFVEKINRLHVPFPGKLPYV